MWMCVFAPIQAKERHADLPSSASVGQRYIYRAPIPLIKTCPTTLTLNYEVN